MNNTSFLQKVYRECNLLGLAETQDDFSRLCGRTPTWFSSLKARGIPLSASAAIVLHWKLNQSLERKIPHQLHTSARQLMDELMSFAQQRSLKQKVEN